MSDPSEPIAAALRLAAIVEWCDDAIISKDLNGIVTTWNRAAERIFGYRADEIIGKPITTLIPDDRLDEEVYVLTCIRNGQSVDHFETIRQHKSGAAIPVSLTVSPIRAPDGTVIGASKIARDISDRRQSERAIAESESRRRRLQERLMALVEGSGVLFDSPRAKDVFQNLIKVAETLIPADGYAVWRFDRAARCWDIAASMNLSPAFVRDIVAVYRGRPEGQGPPPDGPTALSDVNDLPDMGNRRAVHKAEGITSILGVPLGLPRSGAAGSLALYYRTPRMFEETDIQIARAVGNLGGAAITTAQLYEAQRRTQLDVTRAYRQATTANRAKDEFLATLSHELRTPLNAVLGWVRMLRVGAVPAERVDRAIEVIERNANAQLRLVEDMLDLSRIITGKLRLEAQPTRLSDAISAAIETVMPAANAKEIVVHVATEQGDCVIGDAERLQQVVWNLLSNAVKFTPRGGRIEVTLRTFASSVELEVADTGEGIEPEILPYVFDRFRQADSGTTRTHMGLGLGLAIVRHIVEMHGGRVSASSGGHMQGSTFRLSLPAAARGSTQALPKRTVAPVGHSLPPALFGMRALVVDQDPDSRDSLSRLLEERGLIVDAVESMAEGLAAISDELPDFIVSGFEPDGDDCRSLVRALRERGGRSGDTVPVIALNEGTLERAPRSGVHAVGKPVDPDALFSVIERLTAAQARNE